MFQAIPAVKAGRYHRMSEEFTAAFFRPNVLNIDVAIAGFNEILSK